ncbi:MAG: hypothetical protein HOP30_22590, partial [Cyclobacteriaceae bacterium]|nr:hypothetical protein [Cyclobacteriaceae bacterium]
MTGVCLTAGLFAQTPLVKSFDYHRADSIAAHYQYHSLQDTRGLALKLTTPLSTEHEKYRALFRWVCTNIRNDYGLYIKVKQIRKRYLTDSLSLAVWNQKLSQQIFRQLREKHSTICTGYAYLIRVLTQHAGLSCKMIDGYARTSQTNINGNGIPNHSWNAVRLDSVWYMSDATWASGQVHEPGGIFVANFNESYFLISPTAFARSHYPLKSSFLFLNNKHTLSDFLNAPLAYSASYDYAISPVTPSEFFLTVNKGEAVNFIVRQERGNALHKLALQVNDFEVASLVEPCVELNHGNYNLTHTFTSRGIMAVHVLCDGRPVYSYR